MPRRRPGGISDVHRHLARARIGVEERLCFFGTTSKYHSNEDPHPPQSLFTPLQSHPPGFLSTMGLRNLFQRCFQRRGVSTRGLLVSLIKKCRQLLPCSNRHSDGLTPRRRNIRGHRHRLLGCNAELLHRSVKLRILEKELRLRVYSSSNRHG